jgi:hypothetical protein
MDRLEAMLRPVRQRVAGVMEISIKLVEQLPIGPTGKRLIVDQKLELPLMSALAVIDGRQLPRVRESGRDRYPGI